MALIPPDRLADWTVGTYVGVPGGIPTNRTTLLDVTQAPYNADNTGATDCVTAIHAARDAAATGEVVYLPAGTYRCDSSLTFGTAFNGKTLRGDGFELTIIDSRANVGIHLGVEAGYTGGQTVTAGKEQGSTVITIDDTSGYTVGRMLLIQYIGADNTLPVIDTFGYIGRRAQYTTLAAKTGTTLTLSEPLRADVGPTTTLVYEVSSSGSGVGIEGLTVDQTNYTTGGGSYAGIQCETIKGCWIKNVRCTAPLHYGIAAAPAVGCEFRRCLLDEPKGGGSNGAGFVLSSVCASLIEDNTVIDFQPALEDNFGFTGNVVAYNYCEGFFGIDANHGPHNSFNLYESNKATRIIWDGYFGSASEDTAHRNYFTGVDSFSNKAADLKRFTRNMNLTGNVMGAGISTGQPNIGNPDSTGTAQLSQGDPWADFLATGTITLRTSDNAGEVTISNGSFSNGQNMFISATPGTVIAGAAGVQSGSVVPFTTAGVLPALSAAVDVFMGNAGYQELDLDVEATIIQKWNYIIDTLQTDADPLPVSYYTTQVAQIARGMIWGGLQFPTVDPTNPGSIGTLPAEYRYNNNNDDPPEGDAPGGAISGLCKLGGTVTLG